MKKNKKRKSLLKGKETAASRGTSRYSTGSGGSHRDIRRPGRISHDHLIALLNSPRRSQTVSGPGGPSWAGRAR